MYWRTILLAWPLLAVLSHNSTAQTDGTSIGVYADSVGTQPCVTVDQFAKLYVIAKLPGVTARGIMGAEFRIEVEIPSGWSFFYTKPETSIQTGDPMDMNPQDPNDGAGLRLRWGTCKMTVDGKVGLGTILVVRAVGAPPTRLFVKPHSVPSNEDHSCALFTRCDSPAYPKDCVTAVEQSCSLPTAMTDATIFIAGLNIEPGGRRKKLTASHVVEILWSERKAAVSFIRADNEGLADVALGGTVEEIVDDLVAGDPSYRKRSISGRLVIYPSSHTFDQIVRLPAGVCEDLSRTYAADAYADWLKGHAPGFEDLVPPPFIGSMRGLAAEEHVTLAREATVVEHLVQLLGSDPDRSFEISPALTGLPMLTYRSIVWDPSVPPHR